MSPIHAARPALLRALLAYFLALASISIPVGHDLSLGASPSDGTWSLVPPPTPSARALSGAVFDPVRNRMMVIGGSPGPMGDVWAQPLTGPPLWSRLVPAGAAPSGRFAHSVIYQPTQDRVILFGGYDGAYRNDVWALSLSGTPAWIQLTPAGSPPAPRYEHVAVYDASRDRMIIFFGGQYNAPLDDAWALSLGATPTWTQLTPAGSPPLSRARAVGVYDSNGDQVVVFGGDHVSQFLGDVWTLSLAGGGAWTQLLPTG